MVAHERIISRFSVGEQSIVQFPRRPPPVRKPAVLFFPSAGGMADQYHDAALSNVNAGRARLMRAICNAGHVCAAGDCGGANQFGNTTAGDRAVTMYSAVQALPMVAPGPVVLVGCSMGLATAGAFARRDITRVKGIVSCFGLADIDDGYNNNRGGLQAAIGAAHGVTPPAPLPANLSLVRNASELGNVPWRGFYASDDPLCPPSTQLALAAAMRNAKVVDVGPVGHDDDVIWGAFDQIVQAVLEVAA